MQAVNLPPLLWVTRHNGDFEKIMDEDGHEMLPIRFPAISIEFLESSFQSGSMIATGEGIIRVRVAYDNRASGYQPNSITITQPKFLYDMRFVEQVIFVLSGFAASGTSGLQLTNVAYDEDHRNLQVHTLDFAYMMRACIKPQSTTATAQGLCAIPSYPTPPAWSATISYQRGQKVTHSNIIYIALKTTQNHQPDSTPSAWRNITGNELFILP